MVQVLCYIGHGFNTCWRPASIALNVVEFGNGVPTAAWSAVRFM